MGFGVEGSVCANNFFSCNWNVIYLFLQSEFVYAEWYLKVMVDFHLLYSGYEYLLTTPPLNSFSFLRCHKRANSNIQCSYIKCHLSHGYTHPFIVNCYWERSKKKRQRFPPHLVLSTTVKYFFSNFLERKIKHTFLYRYMNVCACESGEGEGCAFKILFHMWS